MKILTPLLLSLAVSAPALAQDFDVQAAPFNALRWSQTQPDRPEVRLAGEWFGWTAIDEVPVIELVSFCKQRWPRRWRKRVGEDLVEALALMKRPVGTKVKLEIVELETGAALIREAVAMTAANRRAVLAYAQGAEEVLELGAEPAVGKPAPRLVGQSLAGDPIALEALRGKVVLVDFWATWCAPCVAEIPALKKAHAAWSERGLVILGVSLDDAHAGEKVRELVAERSLPWTVLHDPRAGNAAAAAAWKISAIPQCFLIDGEGVVRASDLRGAQVEAAVGQLLTTGKVVTRDLPAPGELERAKKDDDDFPVLSPFTAVRVNGADYEVELENAWYRLVSLSGFSAAAIRSHCDERYGSKSEKRFAEDLVEVLDGMGCEVGEQVDLVLEDLESAERIEREGVPMTEENRRRVWEARNNAARTDSAARRVERVERRHSARVESEFAYLAEELSWKGLAGGPKLTRAAAERDLDQLEWLVTNTYSYRDLRGVDFRAAFDALRVGLGDEIPSGAFATRVAQLLALFGDGHTRVRGLERVRPNGYLPFLVADAEGGVFAFREDRRGFVDDAHPYLVSIDGRSIDAWLALTARTLAAGSTQFIRYHGLRDLRLLNALRVEAGAEPATEVEVVLADDEGAERTVRLEIARRKPTYGPWPRTSEHQLLEGNVGYLRIPAMDDEPEILASLVEAMGRFRETRGLVIDVRGNGGGTRDALRTLLPYFLAPEEGPHVANIGAYRLQPGEERERPEGFLGNRAMYPVGSRRWNAEERSAIERARHDFSPDWTPEPELFSEWHYLVLSPGGAFHYDRPLIILCDTGCFSATDIFLGAFSGLPRVTLLGTPSGGGSGRSQGSTLAESRVALRLSSMASFRPDGRRYDGLGVEPDVLHLPLATDFLADGGDSALAAALERLR